MEQIDGFYQRKKIDKQYKNLSRMFEIIQGFLGISTNPENFKISERKFLWFFLQKKRSKVAVFK